MPRTNPFKARDAEIADLKRQLADLQSTQAMQPFVDEFTRNVMTILAYKHMSQWPAEARYAFKAAADAIPTGAAIYQRRNMRNDKD